MPLSLLPSQARTVIENSEGRLGLNSAPKGHTKERHVSISRDGLTDRMLQGGGNNGDVFWRSAFLDIHSCAELLSQCIQALSANDFVRDFHRQNDGAILNGGATEVNLPMFWCRDWRGRAPASHLKLSLQKHNDRPHCLHLITFYPYIPLA